MCLRLVLCRSPWPGWHSSSRDACPAASFPLRHVPFPLSSSPLCLGMLCSAMGGCSVNCPRGTDPGEKESIRIKPKETIFSAISFSVGSTARVRGGTSQGTPWFTLHCCQRKPPTTLSPCHVKQQPEHGQFPYAYVNRILVFCFSTQSSILKGRVVIFLENSHCFVSK